LNIQTNYNQKFIQLGQSNRLIDPCKIKQASAVAITSGVSIDVAYANGVAVFTETLGGLMYEALI
jgi:hypothetical protein